MMRCHTSLPGQDLDLLPLETECTVHRNAEHDKSNRKKQLTKLTAVSHKKKLFILWISNLASSMQTVTVS